MQMLEKRFEDTIFCYDQIERQDTIAIYSQTHKASRIKRYEVVKIRIRPPHLFPSGTLLPEHEAYPSSRSWGQDGWTFQTLPEARRHYVELGREILV